MFEKIRTKLSEIWDSYVGILSGNEIPRPLVSRRKANVFATLVLVTGAVLLYYTQFWWPGSVLVLWAALALRQYLRNRVLDLVISTFVYGALFLSLWVTIDWESLMPVLLSLAAFTIAIRELLMLRPLSPSQAIEEKELELEDDGDL